MNITLEKQFELENIIKAKEKWPEFKTRIAFLHRLYRTAALNREQYLHEHMLSTLAFAKEIKEIN